MDRQQTYQADCRFFSGYKPCSKNEVCSSQCPAKELAQPRVLIVHLEALGAVLRGTVVLSAIKKKWPNAHITWMTAPSAYPLLENNPLVDRILKNDHQGAIALSTLAFDYGFCIDKSLAAAGLLKIPTIKEMRGFGVEPTTGAIVPLNPEAQRLYELGLSNHEKFFVNTKPENQLIVESLGLNFSQDQYVFKFTSDEELLIKKERRDLGLEGFSGPVIGLNTGCSPTIPYKKLSVQGWIALVQTLKRNFPQARFLLLGGPEDAERNREIASRRPRDVTSTPTDQGLRVGMRYVEQCSVVVTGDSLGMHMAIALKKWVVAWFGPTCAHEIDFYERGVAVKTSAGCSPCWKRFCDKAQMCYDLVNWEVISDGVKKGLEADKEFALSAKKLPEITV